MIRKITLLPVLLLTVSVKADIHPDVQAALSWEPPAHNCEAPPARYRQVIVNEEGVPESNRHMNPAHQRLLDKKKKKYDECIAAYKRGLIAEFGKLKDVARHGLTVAQSEEILSKLALIQAVVEDPLAQIPDENGMR